MDLRSGRGAGFDDAAGKAGAVHQPTCLRPSHVPLLSLTVSCPGARHRQNVRPLPGGTPPQRQSRPSRHHSGADVGTRSLCEILAPGRRRARAHEIRTPRGMPVRVPGRPMWPARSCCRPIASLSSAGAACWSLDGVPCDFSGARGRSVAGFLDAWWTRTLRDGTQAAVGRRHHGSGDGIMGEGGLDGQLVSAVRAGDARAVPHRFAGSGASQRRLISASIGTGSYGCWSHDHNS